MAAPSPSSQGKAGRLCLCPEITNWGPCAPPGYGSRVRGWLGTHSPGQGCALHGRVTDSLRPGEELCLPVPRKRRRSSPHPTREAPDVLPASRPPHPWTSGWGRGWESDEAPGWLGTGAAGPQGAAMAGVAWVTVKGWAAPRLRPTQRAFRSSWKGQLVLAQAETAPSSSCCYGRALARLLDHAKHHPSVPPTPEAGTGQGPGPSEGQDGPGPASSRNFLASFSPLLNHQRPPQPCSQALGCSPPDPGSSSRLPV